MRKLSLIIIAFTLVLFTQCKKEKITENTNPVGLDGKMVPITLELPVDNGAKTNFDDFLEIDPSDPQGTIKRTIKWRTNVQETVYLAVPDVTVNNPFTGLPINFNCAQMIPLRGTLTQGQEYITFTGTVNSAVLNKGYTYTLYYFGNNGDKNDDDYDGVAIRYHYKLDDNFEPMYDENNEPILDKERIASVTMSLDGQDGTKGNLGNYHFATLGDVHVHVNTVTNNNVQVPSSFEIHANNRFFTSQVAIAYLDFKNLVNKQLTTDSDKTMPNKIEVKFNSGTNLYDINYVGDENTNYIQLNNSSVSENSFIVLAPGLTTINAEGKGTYTFKNGGTEANHVYYTHNIPTNQILPLKWE